MSLANAEAMMLVIPAARAAISKILAKGGMPQIEIAKMLGITQAAISKYLSGDYSKRVKELEKGISSEGIAERIASQVISGASVSDIAASLDLIARNKAIMRLALGISAKRGK
ncbi:MAG: helix-turn-helix domain-containing protein [Candidatus Micrarchaeota archaeon]|nr:helix-turn-helix domain-containing protein [Candidatus Micrarchaeota archaeon]